MLRRSRTFTDGGPPNNREKSSGSAADHDLSFGSETSKFILVARPCLSLSESTSETCIDPTDEIGGFSICLISSCVVRLLPALQEFSSKADTKVISFLLSSP